KGSDAASGSKTGSGEASAAGTKSHGPGDGSGSGSGSGAASGSGSGAAADTTPPGPFAIVAPAPPIYGHSFDLHWTNATDATAYDAWLSSVATCLDETSPKQHVAHSPVTFSGVAFGAHYACVTAFDAATNARNADNFGLAVTNLTRDGVIAF